MGEIVADWPAGTAMTSPCRSVVGWPLSVMVAGEIAIATEAMGEAAIMQGAGWMQMVRATASSGEVRRRLGGSSSKPGTISKTSSDANRVGIRVSDPSR